MFALRSLAAGFALASLAGCGGAAANSDWVREPEGGRLGGGEALGLGSDAAADTTSDSAPKSGPQRLDHTVTLGSVVATSPAPATPDAAASSSSVVINLNNYGGGYGSTPYYGGGYGAPYSGYAPYFAGSRWGGGAAHAGTAPGRSGSGSTQPGQSWPAAPSYGPSFPYQLSPASPWETKR
jgi:hypothetical protein